MTQSAIVTGGAGSLGRAVIARLAAEGLQTASIDRAPTAVPGATVSFPSVELSDPQSVEAAFAAAAAQLAGVDFLVNAAGGFLWRPVADGALEDWNVMFDGNLRSAVAASRAALRWLREGGAIVNVGAAAALNPGLGLAPYAASKAGVHALTASLAEELKPKRIRVNAILPTILDTPANRAAMPEADVTTWISTEAAADAIAFLLSPASRAITGACIPLSLGRSA